MAFKMAAALRSAACSSASKRIFASKRLSSNGLKFISTSGKKGETPAITEQPPSQGFTKRYGLYDKSSEPIQPENRDWISYGFSIRDEAEDRFYMKMLGFSGITLILVGGAFILAYQPDLNARDWVRREAHLELHRREKLGLALISKDYLDPSDMPLPSEEEIGDTEIII